MRNPIVVAAVLATAALVACGRSSPRAPSSAKPLNPTAKEKSPPGDIPDNQVYVPYPVPGAGITLKVPEGWSRRTAGGTVVFTDNLNSVRIQTTHASALPSAPTIKSSVKGGSVSTLARAGGVALRVKYLATAPPNSVTGKSVTDAVERYYYVHNGRELVLTLSGP